jgi:FecR protein
MKTLQELIAAWDAGALSTEDAAELKQLLAQPEARTELVGEWLLDEAIYDTLRSQPSAAPVTSPAPALQPQRPSVRAATPRRHRFFPKLVWREARITIRWPFGFAVAAAFVVAGVWLYYQAAAVGQLQEVKARVVVERGAKTFAAQRGQLLYPGDLVKVPADGESTVAWQNEPTRLVLEPGAQLEVLSPIRGKRLWLRAGVLQAIVAPQPHWRPMSLLTPQARATVVGTRFILAATNGMTRLEVIEGAVRLAKTHLTAIDTLAEVTVRAGELAVAAPNMKLAVNAIRGKLTADTWAAPPGTPFVEATTRGTLANGNLLPATENRITRYRGFFTAPDSGEFTFWLATPSNHALAELHLSTDEDPAHKKKIADVTPSKTKGNSIGRQPGTPARPLLNFQEALNQKSLPQKLTAGQRYYFELWEEGVEGETAVVGWRLPNQPVNSKIVPMDQTCLSPSNQPAGAAGR